MRLYTTTKGLAREDTEGVLSLVALDHPDVGALLAHGDVGLVAAADVRDELALADATVLAPVLRPGKVPIIGLNYHSHAQEVLEAMRAFGKEVEMPKEPNVHLTPGSSVMGTGEAIVLPRVAPDQVDYEGEIGVVIGPRAYDVTEKDAWRHVAGLTVANDVSARDIQFRAMTGDSSVSVGLAKSLHTFKPMGPCLLTVDEVEEPLDLGLRTVVNGEVRQDARTDDFVYQVSELIAHVSRFMALEPGDVLLTGSPMGSGQFEGKFLRDGDVVEVTVERIGTLRNHVVNQ